MQLKMILKVSLNSKSAEACEQPSQPSRSLQRRGMPVRQGATLQPSTTTNTAATLQPCTTTNTAG